jgi:hypothetical protein
MKIATFTLNALPTPPAAPPRRSFQAMLEPALRGFLMGGALVAMLIATSLVFANP